MTKQLKILVLDDHVDVAESVGEILELEGHEVTLVHSGIGAVEAFKAHNFDLGFFDVKMPGMNGVESFIEVRKLRPEARIFMMSGYADDSLIARALQGGALGLLKKPFDVEDLLAKLGETASGAVAA